MKKLSLIVLACVCGYSAYASECKLEDLTFIGTQVAEDNEFLYENGADALWNQKGYECDDDYCESGVTITMWPGHYWMGEKIDETRTYRCHTGVLDDRWEVVSNDDSGDIVSTRWCNLNTPVGSSSYLSENTDPEDFANLKAELKAENTDNDYADEIVALCTEKGWDKAQITHCEAPYVSCDGQCTYYLDALRIALEYVNMTYEDHFKRLGISEEEYEDYVAGRIEDEAKLISIVKDDATLKAGCRADYVIDDNGLEIGFVTKAVDVGYVTE